MVAVVAALVGFVFHVRIITLPTDTLIARYLADDYFYYLNVAFNIAHGHGSSFDGGLTSTNGYQPLFLFSLVPVFALGASKLAAIQIGLLLQALALVVASLGIYAIAARNGSPWGGALGAGLLNLNLFFVLPTLTGFEMALALAASIWTIWCWHAGKSPVMVGVLCGLAALARVDSLILLLIFTAILFSQGRLRDLVQLIVAFLIIVAPWAAWSTYRFAAPFPDSGLIKAHYRGLKAVALNVTTILRALPRVIVPGRFVDGAALSHVQQGTLWVCALLILLAAAVVARHAANRVVVLFALVLAASYVLLIDPSENGALVRYMFPVWAIILLLLAQNPIAWRWWLVSLLLAAHVADLATYVRWERTAPSSVSYVGVSHQLAATIDALTRPDDVIGAFDSGSLGYFSSRPVVNLDGLANHDIVDLRRRCQGAYPTCMLEYLRERQITLLAGGTGFGWTNLFPDWKTWPRILESSPLADGSRLVVLRIPK